MRAWLLVLCTAIMACAEPTAAEKRLKEWEEERRNTPRDTTGDAARMEEYQRALNSWEIRGFPGCDPLTASTVAEHYVRKNLKSPSEADFAEHNDENVKHDDGRITYVGYVDAPNSFNAVQRMYFKVWMECRHGGLAVVDVKFE